MCGFSCMCIYHAKSLKHAASGYFLAHTLCSGLSSSACGSEGLTEDAFTIVLLLQSHACEDSLSLPLTEHVNNVYRILYPSTHIKISSLKITLVSQRSWTLLPFGTLSGILRSYESTLCDLPPPPQSLGFVSLEHRQLLPNPSLLLVKNADS